MRPRRTAARACASGLHGYNGFCPAHPPRDAREAPRISERFQIKKNDVGVVIDFPVLQQIIARNVRFVAYTYECREAQVTALRQLKNRESQRPALRGHREFA